MAFPLVLLYCLASLLQPAEWISICEGKPVQELILALAWLFLIPKITDGALLRLLRQPQTRCFVGFIIVSIIGVFKEGILEYAIMEVGYNYLKFFLAYLMLVLALDSIPKVKTCMVIFIIGACIISIFCLRLNYSGIGVGVGIGVNPAGQSLSWRGAVKWVGTYDGANGTALLLVAALGLSIGFLIQKGSFVFRLLGLTSSYLISHTFYLTHSRGGFMGILIVAACYIYTCTRIRLKFYIPIVLIMCLGIIILKPTEEGRGLGESSSSERINLFHHGIQMFKSNPILGIGVNQFEHNNPVRKIAHNIFLQQFAETGIVGVMFFTLIFYTTVRTLLSFIKVTDQITEENKTAVKLIISYIGMGTCLFFLTFANEIPYLWLALCTAIPFSQGMNGHLTLKDFYIVGVINIVLIALIYILVQLFFVVF